MKGDMALFPGQILRLEGHASSYAQIQSVILPERGETGYRVALDVLQGCPRFEPMGATVLSPERAWEEVRRLDGISVAHPLMLGQQVLGEMQNLGTLTVVEGMTWQETCPILTSLAMGLSEYQQVLIVDPLGMFQGGSTFSKVHAGQDSRLSLNDVGLKRLIRCLDLPRSVEVEAASYITQQMAKVLQKEAFVPFESVFPLDSPEGLREGPRAKALLWHSLEKLRQQQLFADDPAQVFSLDPAATERVTVLDLSGLAEPWKTLFYETVCHKLLRRDSEDIMPVLIYPDSYLEDLPQWVRKADEVERLAVMMISPYADEQIVEMANNQIVVVSEAAFEMTGQLTHGIPVRVHVEQLEQAYQPILEEHLKPIPMGEPDMTTPALHLGPSNEMPNEMPMNTGLWKEVPPEPQDSRSKGLGSGLESFEESDIIFPDSVGEEPMPDSWVAPPLTEEIPRSELLPAAMPEAIPELTQAEPRFDSILGETGEFMFDLDLDEKMGVDNDPNGPLGIEQPPFREPVIPEEPPAAVWVEDSPAVTQPDESAEPFMSPEVSSGLEEQSPVPVYPTKQLEQQQVMAQAGFQVGEKVQHERYGIGIVNKVIPMEETVILNITFENVGKRLMDPALTQLEKVS